MLIASLEVLLIALGIQILCWLDGKILFEFAEPGKKKVLQYATICSNAGFMGNPIIEGIYGQEGLLYASWLHFCEYTAVAFDNPGVECADAGDINDLWNDSSEAYITYIIGSDRVGFILV